MWFLSLDNNLKSSSKEEFEVFVSDLVKKRKQQIAQLYNSMPSTFYMWFDEMAAQLRFNVIAGHNVQLPFGCQVEVVDSVEPIWKDFKESQNHEGISWSELEPLEDDFEEDEEPYVLKVYVEYI